MESMTTAEIVNFGIGALVVIGGGAMGIKRFLLPNSKKNGNSRTKLSSDESKEAISELWDKKTDKEMCEVISNNLAEKLADVKVEQVYQRKLMINIARSVNAEVPE